MAERLTVNQNVTSSNLVWRVVGVVNRVDFFLCHLVYLILNI